jgi:hypothetical protein
MSTQTITLRGDALAAARSIVIGEVSHLAQDPADWGEIEALVSALRVLAAVGSEEEAPAAHESDGRALGAREADALAAIIHGAYWASDECSTPYTPTPDDDPGFLAYVERGEAHVARRRRQARLVLEAIGAQS